MNLATVLPLAIVMIAGPQIISAVFFATSVNWKGTSAAYVLGAAVSITVVFSAAYFVAEGAGDSEASHHGTSNGVEVAVLVLLLFLLVRVYTQRDKPEPPKWMGKLQTATPRFAFLLGLLLLGIFPTDILTSVSVGAHLANRGAAWTDGLGFVALTLILLGLPALLVVALGARARVLLPRVRDWINANSWIISEIVIVFFIGATIKSLVS